MILTTKGWCSVMALVHITMEKPKAIIDLQDIADTQNISYNYLRQLFIKMEEAGLVIKKGKAKYVLAKEPADILITDVMVAVGESVQQYNAMLEEEQKKVGEARAMTEQFQSFLDKQMHVMIEGVSLRSIIEGGYGAEHHEEVALKLVSNL